MRRAKENNIDVTALARGLINLHDIKLESLPIMYAISGSDQTSFLYGIGKTKAWNTYLEHHVSHHTHMHYKQN